jgi:endonuclease/exonuclease/phosphatase family metal-dependent hydrolase
MQSAEITTGNFAPWRLWPPSALKVVCWNIDRGLHLPGVIDFLTQADADILLLQEVDINAWRTHRLNVAQEIAERLRLNFVFGREFVELTQGTKQHPAYHGQTTLARWPISNPRLIRFRRQSNFWRPRWFIPPTEPFQERLGGRVALVVEINVAGERITTYNLHLESRGNDELRLSQLEEVVLDVTRQTPAGLAIIAGDLNIDVSKRSIMTPLERAGLRVASPTARVGTTRSLGFLYAARHIDWIFTRGPMEAYGGNVHQHVTASDHYPVTVNVRRTR